MHLPTARSFHKLLRLKWVQQMLRRPQEYEGLRTVMLGTYSWDHHLLSIPLGS